MTVQFQRVKARMLLTVYEFKIRHQSQIGNILEQIKPPCLTRNRNKRNK